MKTPAPIPSIALDDPRVTAFALGETAEIAPADLRALESAVASDPALAAEVEAIRATARDARGLLGTAAPGLAPSQRDAILAAAAKPARSRDPIRRWAPFGIGMATAASLLLVFGLRGGTSGTAKSAEIANSAGNVALNKDLSGHTAWAEEASNILGWKQEARTPGSVVSLDEVTNGLANGGSAARDNGGPGLPAGAALNPSAGAYFNDGQDGSFRGRTESIFERRLAEAESALHGPGRGTRRSFYPSHAKPVLRVSPSGGGGGNSGDLSGRMLTPESDSGAGGGGTASDPTSFGSTNFGLTTFADRDGDGRLSSRQFQFTSDVAVDAKLTTAEVNAARTLSKVQGFLLISGDSDNRAPAPGTSTTANWNGFRIIGPDGKAAQNVRVVFDGAGRPAVCADGTPTFYAAGYGQPVEAASGEAYARVVEQAFLRPGDSPLSTFSIDVDTASYSNVRRMLMDGQRPPVDAVRVEELLNYFPYQYAPPAAGAEPFAVHLEATACPWNLKHRLVRVGIKGREMERKARPPMNLVFLLDVSGSMDAPNKLPLVKASMRMLLDELNERDSVAIVTYAGESGVALNPTWCEQKATIQKAIDGLAAGGSTNGASGIALAYQTAALRFNKDSINRVVLATDGDFNVGATSHAELLALITEKAKTGVFLTALGFGMGNLKDATLELLADKGNGNYGYIDSTKEAHKVLVEQASGTLVTIAKDVKIQVEFNPKTVASYRLVGYDNRVMAAKDFADDTKDAGEIGAGHTVTALYEIVPVGADEAPAKKPEEEPLRYGPVTPPHNVAVSGVAVDLTAQELLTVKLRWKEPAGTTSVKKEFPLTDSGLDYAKASADTKFAASVAAFALLLKGSPYAGNASLDGVSEWAGEGLAFDPNGYRKEFLDLVAKAKTLMVPATPAAPTTK